MESAGASRGWGVKAEEAAGVMVRWPVESAGSSWQGLVTGWRWEAAPEEVVVLEAAGNSGSVVQSLEAAGRGSCQC